ncbi:YbaK/prolyl-tRNA synthetase associated region [Halorubrum aidingense JCM 13560]|uniref:YbaK/prolyl-tRNA synthetase associated region n=1 Tax=Halorubrum aidingense JCM 13560 TaxID=1230454 RepID=M0PFN4_9EURY|nr:YbaK/EbsC family protein [Halorubrum aidingense]EMA68708.1 YbaK/prolyl-tRNA synthetase associated region [Halorubrum aidingense JCM 13560]
MHERAAEFTERARDRYDVEIDVLEFDAGTETAAAAADAVGCATAAIASTIVVSLSGAGDSSGSGDTLVAAITSGANRLDLDAVADHFDASAASMADPGRIRDTVGWSIGGVPPLCHDAALPTVFDPTLTAYETVYGAAGTPSTVFAIDPETLAALADATVVDLTE